MFVRRLRTYVLRGKYTPFLYMHLTKELFDNRDVKMDINDKVINNIIFLINCFNKKKNELIKCIENIEVLDNKYKIKYSDNIQEICEKPEIEGFWFALEVYYKDDMLLDEGVHFDEKEKEFNNIDTLIEARDTTREQDETLSYINQHMRSMESTLNEIVDLLNTEV